MLAVSFESTFLAMLQIFILGSVGFFLVKTKHLDIKGLEVLSALVINIILPVFNFSRIIGHFDPQGLANWWIFPLLGFAVSLGGFVLASGILAFNPSFKARNEFKALISFQNSGYIPLSILAAFPMTEEVAALTVYILIFLIGFDTLVWTLGVGLMTSSSGQRFEWRKIFNPPMMAILGSVILMLLGIGQRIPQVIMKPATMLGDCLLPMVMLVLGGNFAVMSFKRLPAMNISGVVLTKLIVYPLLMITLLFFIPVVPLIGFLLVMEAAMPCANSLSVIGRHYRTPNQEFINQSLFFTNILSVLTIPLFLSLFMILFM
jgi:malate permease and related proteins